jgi:4-alpha-glucanotransferase
MNLRRCGILLHITSLPSPYGIGDFGEAAYKFVDFLAETRQCLWQILPLNPTCSVYGNSPYSSNSAFAGNHIMISLDLLVQDGILSKADIEDPPTFRDDRVDYEAVTAYKANILRLAFDNIQGKLEGDSEFKRFCCDNAYWLDDYALFVTLKDHFQGAIWSDWPDDIKRREIDAVRFWKEKLKDMILLEKFSQHLFFKQWFLLKEYSNSKNIQIMGDIPIYVTYDSADVWAKPEIFKLDDAKKLMFVAGVPPDYFSTTGQLWGNPVYNWDVLKETGYSWWLRRIEFNLKLFDIVRFDHFRGFVSYWEVPAGEKTAVSGRWVNTPVKDFFNILYRHFPSLPIIAEDLGEEITPEVREIMSIFEIPGMKVLQYAFGKDLPASPFIPHYYTTSCVVYTGTHDNNTTKGWYKKEISYEDRDRIQKYLGGDITEDNIHSHLIRLAMMSVANMVVIPLQDILGLGEESRMNFPSTSENNWEWRLLPEQITSELIRELTKITVIYGRA